MGSCQSRTSVSKEQNTKISTSPEESSTSKDDSSPDDSEILANRSSKASDRHEHIIRWKEELEASGNLTKTVVNIEVSSVPF